MFSMTYFIQTIKSNAKTCLALTLVPSVFLVIMTNVFTPTTISSLESTLGLATAWCLTSWVVQALA